MRATTLGYVLVGVTISLAVGARPAAALEPPHDVSNNIACLDCHAAHSTSQALKPRDLEQATVCLGCHNPTGQAASLADVDVHLVSNGTRLVDCGSCHDAHGPVTTTDASHTGGTTAPNLWLVRGDPGKYVPGALQPMLFQARPAHFAFDNGGGPYNAVCQSCHTATEVHRSNGSVDNSHNVSTDCTQCHSHKTGFLPTSCVGCHAGPQDNGDATPLGGRRAVIAEFPTSTIHGHVSQNPVSDDDCLVCHAVSTHQNGVIELVDPDSGAIYSFVKPTDLTSDPDVSNFCANCHDSDGAARLATPMDPFGTGNPPSDVKRKFQGTLVWNEWYGDFCFGAEGTTRVVNSHHDIDDVDQALSGAKLECLNCHSAHGSSDASPVADPWSPTTPWSGTMSLFCLQCHAGGSDPSDPGMPPGVRTSTIRIDAAGNPCDGPYDDGCATYSEVSGLRPLESCDYYGAPWHVEYRYGHTAHGGDSKRDWPQYSTAPKAELSCLVCHDSHGSTSASNLEGNPYMIRDWVDGTPYVDDGVRPSAQWSGPPWTLTGQSRQVIVTVTQGANPPPAGADYATVDWGGATGLCSTCHSNWLASYSWHSMCTGCQTCHGHGQAWENNDWGDGGNDTSCAECGNGVLDGPEECDDGNQVSGDGCSNECTTE